MYAGCFIFPSWYLVAATTAGIGATESSRRATRERGHVHATRHVTRCDLHARPLALAIPPTPQYLRVDSDDCLAYSDTGPAPYIKPCSTLSRIQVFIPRDLFVLVCTSHSPPPLVLPNTPPACIEPSSHTTPVAWARLVLRTLEGSRRVCISVIFVL